MNLRRLMVAVGSVFVVPVLIHCSYEVGKGNGSSPRMGTMNNGGAAITSILPPDPQPNDDVSFANDIQPIFDEHCTQCHNGTLLRGGLDLTAGNSYDMLLNHPV